MKSKLFNIYEMIFVVISYAIIITFSIIYQTFFLETIATLIGFSACLLNIKGKKIAFFFYAAFAIIYSINCYILHIYGEGILYSVYNFPLYTYTIYKLFLSKNKTDSSDIKINSLKIKHLLILISIVPFITIIYGFVLQKIKSELPYINALATCIALISSFLASKTMKEQWYFWTLYAIIGIILWSIKFYQSSISNGNTSGIIFIVLNILYLISNTYALIIWEKKYRKIK